MGGGGGGHEKDVVQEVAKQCGKESLSYQLGKTTTMKYLGQVRCPDKLPMPRKQIFLAQALRVSSGMCRGGTGAKELIFVFRVGISDLLLES